MSEDEKIIDNFKYWFETNTENGVSTIPDFICKKLLDLCQQEKEKNKKLQIRGKELIEEKQELNTALLYDNISKDKIRAKIKELEEEQKEYKGSQEWEIQDDIDAQINILKELLEED